MGPFAPKRLPTTRVTVGVASANVAVVPGRQVILSAPIGNADIVYVEFGETNAVAAVVPVAGGAKGGTPIFPGNQIELTVPSGQTEVTQANPGGFVGNFLAYISGTAAQSLLITEGGDV